jgi:hypothetical protein
MDEARRLYDLSGKASTEVAISCPELLPIIIIILVLN